MLSARRLPNINRKVYGTLRRKGLRKEIAARTANAITGRQKKKKPKPKK